MIRYSIKKHPFWKRWYVRAHYRDVSAVCQWCESWDDAIGYVQSIYGWQW